MPSGSPLEFQVRAALFPLIRQCLAEGRTRDQVLYSLNQAAFDAFQKLAAAQALTVPGQP